MILTGGNLGRSGILTGGRLSRAAVAAGAPSYTLGVASFAGTTTRNNFDGSLGFKFTLASGATVHSLGRRKISGNSQAHRVFLFDATTGLFLAAGKPDLSTGTAGSDVLTPLVADLVLPAGSYYLLSREPSGGDVWYDAATATGASGVTVDNAAYFTAAAPFRNDFTGRVGYKLTPTANQTLTHVGRYKLDPTDTGTHTVYVTTTAGTVLGSAAVSLSGQPTGMVYAALSGGVALTGGTAYYLVCDETSGGELWLDEMAASLASGFTLNGSVYFDTAYHENTAGKAWPVGFKFGAGTAGLAGLTPGFNNDVAGKAFVFPQFEFY